jgi:hypothetical protein
MEQLRLKPVAFCGENPIISLVSDGTEEVSAAASYWHCTYSAYGEGNVLLLYMNEANATALGQPAVAVYADNAPLGRFLSNTFNQHFDDWKGLGFYRAPVQQARFFRISDSRRFYRVDCHAEQILINLLWEELRDPDFRTFPDLSGGGFGAAGDEHYNVANVIFLCGEGHIVVNQQEAVGVPQTRTLPDGRYSSSVFVALSETWIKITQPT